MGLEDLLSKFVYHLREELLSATWWRLDSVPGGPKCLVKNCYGGECGNLHSGWNMGWPTLNLWKSRKGMLFKLQEILECIQFFIDLGCHG